MSKREKAIVAITVVVVLLLAGLTIWVAESIKQSIRGPQAVSTDYLKVIEAKQVEILEKARPCPPCPTVCIYNDTEGFKTFQWKIGDKTCRGGKRYDKAELEGFWCEK